MNRKIGYGAVTTRSLVTVDKAGRTARHFTGRVRVDYMCDSHFWVIIDQIEGFGDSIPTKPIMSHDIDVAQFTGGIEPPVTTPVDIGEIWIPDSDLAAIRWFTQEW